MNRRGFLRSLVATAAGVLVPAEALASSRVYFDMGRRRWLERGALVADGMRILQPGVYSMRVVGLADVGPHAFSMDVVVRPEAIERGEAIDVPLPVDWPAFMRVNISLARYGDIEP